MNNKFSSSLSLVIPLFNNDQTVVQQIRTSLSILNNLVEDYEVLVCDDSSTDTSAKLLQKYFGKHPRIRLLFHNTNQGVAKTIFQLYKEARNEYVLLYSVDGDWDPDDIRKLIMTQRWSHADLVLGKRNKSVYSLYRQIISRGYNLFTRLMFGVDTVDAGSIKLFKRSLFSGVTITSRSMFFEAEMIIRAVKNSARMVVIPVHFYKKPGDRGRGALFGSVVESLQDAIRLRLTGV